MLGIARPRCGIRGAGAARGDNVGRVPVERPAAAVVAPGRARVGIRGCLLHVTQRHPGVQRDGDERVAQAVR